VDLRRASTRDRQLRLRRLGRAFVNVTLVISQIAGAAVTRRKPGAQTSPPIPYPMRRSLALLCATALASCNRAGQQFRSAHRWPTPLALRVVDNCGAVVTGAQIVTTFTNGDPPLALPLVDPPAACTRARGTPRKAVANLTINARISASGSRI